MYFKLFACCIPVKGFSRSLMCDIQRNQYIEIPNSLYDILSSPVLCTMAELIERYGDEETLREYFDFLIEHDFGFWTPNPELFPPLDLTWEHPSIITNAIIDVNKNSNHDFEAILRQLDDLGCNDLQIRFFDPVAPDKLQQLLRHAATGRLAGISLILPHQEAFTEQWLSVFCENHPRVYEMVFHAANCESSKTLFSKKSRRYQTNVIYTPQVIDSATHCGMIAPYYFTLGANAFIESQSYNSCLNRKVGIDVAGNIKNCPSMDESYGNIHEISVQSAITKKGFKDLWEINKDQIEVCKDCEFRHICTDCRAFITKPHDRFSKPSKCGYDPYTATWTNQQELSSPA